MNAGIDPVLYPRPHQVVCWGVLAMSYPQDDAESARNEQGDDGEEDTNEMSYILRLRLLLYCLNTGLGSTSTDRGDDRICFCSTGY